MVTVVIYTNNAEKNLKKCVYSILNQTFETLKSLLLMTHQQTGHQKLRCLLKRKTNASGLSER